MIYFFDDVVKYIGEEKKSDAVFISIGSMDGVMFDQMHDYVIKYNFKPVYVEPVPYMFERLKANIKDDRAIFENVAITDYDGITQLLVIDPDAIDNGMVHSCFYGMSSIYPPRNGLASEGDRVTVENFGRMEIVECITLSTLFERNNIEHFDIMSIDTEGHDWKILSKLDLKKFRPSLIKAEYCNLNEHEKSIITKFFSVHNYVFYILGQDIYATPIELYRKLYKDVLHTSNNRTERSNVTIVTALWNLGRHELNNGFKRPYEQYLEQFTELLKTPSNLYIYVAKEDEEFIWKHRSRKNTIIKTMELDEFKNWFPFFEKVQQIRKNSEWSSQAAWLKESPQANLEYYNPIVMSKMFLLNDTTINNPFNTEYFYWLDAGITSTVHGGYFYHDGVIENLPKFSEYIDKFLFISYPYEGGEEIHGFSRKDIARYSNTDYVRYVCRGGFFGGHITHVNHMNNLYYNILDSSLGENLMGTEESIFTILAYTHSDLIYRFEINDDGLVWPFFEALKDVESLISNTPKEITYKTIKNNLYVLTFNSPKQFESICKSIIKSDPNFLERSRNILINNSTDESTFEEYDRLCEEYGFEEIHRENLGVCGGRQFAAEHFDESNADFYMFFEDDMHLNDEEFKSSTCRNGFTQYVPNLYEKIIKIMLKERFDFLKFSFSEFYGDNSIQWAWYNVPQEIRTKYWPEYDKLPELGLDPNAPKTKFDSIKILDGVSYTTGEIYYSNWPQIVSRDANKKMFLDTKWAHPFEQTWMSHIFQLTKENKIRPAVLLASPVTHERFEFYEGNLRKES